MASAVGDIRETLPGMSPQVAKNSDYYADKPLAAPATRKLARELGVGPAARRAEWLGWSRDP